MNIFSPLSEQTKQDLEDFALVLDKVLKPKQVHLKALPRDIADLSTLLTENRHELSRPYWAEARFKAAYLWYFLPWNLVRMANLLPNLSLNLKANDTVLDLGSGPLTFTLALWLSRPELRDTPIKFICTDSQKAPLEAGLAIFKALTKGSSPWKIILHKAGLRESLAQAKQKPVKLICALNMLNELVTERKPLQVILKNINEAMHSAIASDGSILIVEPGNRLGGKIIEELRAIAIASGLHINTPCPHQNPCPILQGMAKTWCHFVEQQPSAPVWLNTLSIRAKLPKTQAALSFLLLNAKKEDNIEAKDAPTSSVWGRVVSNPFKVPGQIDLCRYACTAKGLALIMGAKKIAWGSLVPLTQAAIEKDAKSGATVMLIKTNKTNR